MNTFSKTFFSNSFALFIAIVSTNAQPTLTAANNNPVAGDVFKVFDATLPLIATVQLTGANQTWDFSNVIGYDSTTYEYIDASTTPYYNLVPPATVAIYYPSQGFYNYYSGTTNDFSYLGGTSGSPSGIYSDPYKYYSYPFTYLSSFLDTFVTSSSTCYSTHTADGYGTVIMPYGMVNNVLRHYEHTAIYTSSDTTHQDFYYWIMPGFHWAICSYGNIYNSSGTLYTFFNYTIPASTGFNDLVATKINIECFPNPFSNEINVVVLNGFFKNANIVVKNTLGQTIFSETDFNPVFGQLKTIDLGFLPTGVYVLEVSSCGKKSAKKLLKQ